MYLSFRTKPGTPFSEFFIKIEDKFTKSKVPSEVGDFTVTTSISLKKYYVTLAKIIRSLSLKR